MGNPIYIYCLYDPTWRSNKYYIGKTNQPDVRLYNHNHIPGEISARTEIIPQDWSLPDVKILLPITEQRLEKS